MQERKADQKLINEYRMWASSVGLDLESDDSRDSSSVSVSDGDGEQPSGSKGEQQGGKGGQGEQPIGSSVGSTGGKGEQPSGSKVAENAAGEVAARKAVEEAENGKGKGSSNRLGGAGKNKIIYELKGEEEIRAAVKASVSKAKYVINGNGDSWCMV